MSSDPAVVQGDSGAGVEHENLSKEDNHALTEACFGKMQRQ